MKVLVLSPHTDDAELGCGATIAKHILAGDEVKWVTFSNCAKSLPEDMRSPNRLGMEQERALEKIGVSDWIILGYEVRTFEENINSIRDVIYKLIRKCFKPDIVYTPWRGSLHQDHYTISLCTEQVTRHNTITVLGYYVSDDGIGFAPRYFEPLDEIHVLKKIDALMCYETQGLLRKWWREDIFHATVLYWAPVTAHDYTEAFEVIKTTGK